MADPVDFSRSLEEIRNYLLKADKENQLPNIYFNAFPSAAPDTAVKIAQYGGRVNRESGTERIRIQVMARAKRSGDARTLCTLVADTVATMRGKFRADADAQPVTYLDAYAVTPMTLVGRDAAGLIEFSKNIELERQGMSPV